MDDTYPWVTVSESSGIITIFKIDRKTNIVQVGNINNYSCGIKFDTNSIHLYTKSYLTIYTGSLYK
jgi:hypothetical protein